MISVFLPCGFKAFGSGDVGRVFWEEEWMKNYDPVESR
jgi:hypothetical protein